MFWNPSVEVSNAYRSFFRVNSLFWDASVYGRFMAVTLVLCCRRGRLPRHRPSRSAPRWRSCSRASTSPTRSRATSPWPPGVLAVGTGLWSRRVTLALVGAGAVGLLAVLAVALRGNSAARVSDSRSHLISLGWRVIRHHPAGSAPAWAACRRRRWRARRTRYRVKGAASHTTPVTVAAELGPVGFVLYLWVLGALTAAARAHARRRARAARAARRARGDLRQLALLRLVLRGPVDVASGRVPGGDVDGRRGWSRRSGRAREPGHDRDRRGARARARAGCDARRLPARPDRPGDAPRARVRARLRRRRRHRRRARDRPCPASGDVLRGARDRHRRPVDHGACAAAALRAHRAALAGRHRRRPLRPRHGRRSSSVAIAIVRLRSSPLLNFEMFGPWRYWADGLEIADAGRVPAQTLQWGATWTPTVSKVVLNSYHAGLSYAIGRSPLPAMGALLWVASTGLAAGLWALGRELGLRRLAPLLPLLTLAVLNDELHRNLDVYTAENVGRMVAVCALVLGVRALRDRDGWKEPLLAALLFGAGFATHGVPVVALLVVLGWYARRPRAARPGVARRASCGWSRSPALGGGADRRAPARLGRVDRVPGGVREQLLCVVRQGRRSDGVAAHRHGAAFAGRPRALVRAAGGDHARLRRERDDAVRACRRGSCGCCRSRPSRPRSSCCAGSRPSSRRSAWSRRARRPRCSGSRSCSRTATAPRSPAGSGSTASSTTCRSCSCWPCLALAEAALGRLRAVRAWIPLAVVGGRRGGAGGRGRGHGRPGPARLAAERPRLDGGARLGRRARALRGAHPARPGHAGDVRRGHRAGQRGGGHGAVPAPGDAAHRARDRARRRTGSSSTRRAARRCCTGSASTRCWS